MVKRNSIRTSRRTGPRRNRRRRGVRAAFSRTERVSNNKPVQCRVPSDPFPLSSTLEVSLILPIKILLSEAATPGAETWNYGTLGSVTTVVVYTSPPTSSDANGKPPALPIIASDLTNIMATRFGLNASANAEIAVKKVQYWGPTKSQVQDDLIPELVVNTSTISGGKAVTDVGTEMHRARCGITNPFITWIASDDSSTVLFTVYPSQIGLAITGTIEGGWLYVSVQRATLTLK